MNAGRGLRDSQAVRFGLGLAAVLVAALVAWRSWPAPLSAQPAQLLLGLVLAGALAECLTLDFPDRKGISVGYIFPLVAAGVLGPGYGVAAAGTAAALGALAHRRPLSARVLSGPYAVLAAMVGLLVVQRVFGSVSLLLSLRGALTVLTYAVTYTLVAWLLSELGAWVWAPARLTVLPDLLTSLLLAPIPLALTAIFIRAGLEGLVMASLALALLLVVVRTYVNLKTVHEELRQAYTRLEQQEERLERALEANRELTQIVSHDLRGPLTSIMGYAELLRGSFATVADRTKEQRYLEAMTNNARRMVMLIDRLIDVQHSEEGLKIEFRDVSAVDIVRQAVESLQVQADQKGVALDVALKAPALVRTSDWMLREIADNLISNAIKYTPQGGAVHVRLEQAEDELRLEVEDSGIGIPPQEQAKLFTKFFRGASPEVRKMEGSGLGLALTHSMVAQLGGRIEVNSEIGKGSRFTVRLPEEVRSCAA